MDYIWLLFVRTLKSHELICFKEAHRILWQEGRILYTSLFELKEKESSGDNNHGLQVWFLLQFETNKEFKNS